MFNHLNFVSSLQKDELDDIPIELSKVQSVKVGLTTSASLTDLLSVINLLPNHV